MVGDAVLGEGDSALSWIFFKSISLAIAERSVKAGGFWTSTSEELLDVDDSEEDELLSSSSFNSVALGEERGDEPWFSNTLGDSGEWVWPRELPRVFLPRVWGVWRGEVPSTLAAATQELGDFFNWFGEVELTEARGLNT